MPLILSRRAGQSVKIGSDIEVRICRVQHGQVTISVDAPKGVAVWRSEIAPVDGKERKHVALGLCWCSKFHIDDLEYGKKG